MKLKPSPAFLQKAGKSLKKGSPTILTCIGALGVVLTAVLAVKETPKALEQIEEAKSVKMAENGENLTALETIGACWMTYAPSAAVGIATIGCIFGANVLNRRQQASMASAYAFLDRSFREYKEAVKHVFGEEGHERVMEELMVECPNPPTISGNLFGESFDFGVTNDEKHLFYDSFTKRYFEATFSDVLLAEYHTNRNFAIGGGAVSVQDFYTFLGMDTPEDIKPLAWYVSDYYYFIDFTHTKKFIDDGPGREPIECWVIDMPFPPTLEPLEE